MAKKILMIVAFKNFRDEEYFVPKEVFEKEGFGVETASTKKGTALGLFGGEVEVDLLPEEIKVGDFDAIVFVGGPGTLEYLSSEAFYRIIREAVHNEKVLGAICVAPILLANAGALEGKKATVWSSQMDKKAISIIEKKGAIYEERAVVSDGLIITANGPQAAEDFAKEVIKRV